MRVMNVLNFYGRFVGEINFLISVVSKNRMMIVLIMGIDLCFVLMSDECLVRLWVMSIDMLIFSFVFVERMIVVSLNGLWVVMKFWKLLFVFFIFGWNIKLNVVLSWIVLKVSVISFGRMSKEVVKYLILMWVLCEM